MVENKVENPQVDEIRSEISPIKLTNKKLYFTSKGAQIIIYNTEIPEEVKSTLPGKIRARIVRLGEKIDFIARVWKYKNTTRIYLPAVVVESLTEIWRLQEPIFVDLRLENGQAIIIIGDD